MKTIRDGELRTSTSTFTQQFLSSADVIFFFKCCFRTGSSGWPPRRSHSSWALFLSSSECRFTSTETIRTVRDGELRTSTSTFTQFLSSAAGPHGNLCYIATPSARGKWREDFEQMKLNGLEGRNLKSHTCGYHREHLRVPPRTAKSVAKANVMGFFALPSITSKQPINTSNPNYTSPLIH